MEKFATFFKSGSLNIQERTLPWHIGTAGQNASLKFQVFISPSPSLYDKEKIVHLENEDTQC